MPSMGSIGMGMLADASMVTSTTLASAAMFSDELARHNLRRPQHTTQTFERCDCFGQKLVRRSGVAQLVRAFPEEPELAVRRMQARSHPVPMLVGGAG